MTLPDLTTPPNDGNYITKSNLPRVGRIEVGWLWWASPISNHDCFGRYCLSVFQNQMTLEMARCSYQCSLHHHLRPAVSRQPTWSWLSWRLESPTSGGYSVWYSSLLPLKAVVQLLQDSTLSVRADWSDHIYNAIYVQFCAKRDRTLQSGGSEPSKMHLLQDVPNLCAICEAIYKCHYTSLYNMVPLHSTCAIMLNSELQNMFAEDFRKPQTTLAR